MDTQGKGRRRGRGSYVHSQVGWNHNKHSGANSWSINLYWGAPMCQGNKVVSEKISMKRPKPKQGWNKCQLLGCQMLGVTLHRYLFGKGVKDVESMHRLRESGEKAKLRVRAGFLYHTVSQGPIGSADLLCWIICP